MRYRTLWDMQTAPRNSRYPDNPVVSEATRTGRERVPDDSSATHRITFFVRPEIAKAATMFFRLLSALTWIVLAATSPLNLLGDELAPTTEPVKASEETPIVTDPVEQRRAANAPYVNVPFRTRVAQRFEMYSPRDEQAVKELKAMGFTQVMLDRPDLHQAATDVGLPFVLAHWWNQDTKPEEITAAVERAKQVDQSLLIGFSIMDEPERNAPDTPFGYYIDVYEKLRPQFQKDLAGTRLEISHWGPLAEWTDQHYEYFSFLYEAADVMRIMPYPDLGEGPLDDVFFMMRRTQRPMELAGRNLPLVVILQTWILPPKNQLPEIAELRVMTYLAMLSGAETVSFFDHNPEVWRQKEGFESGFRDLMREVTEFARRYKDWDVETVINADSVLTSVLTSPSGQRHQVTINTQRTAVQNLAALEIREEPLESSPVLLTRQCCPQQCAPVRHYKPERVSARLRTSSRAHKKSCRGFGRTRMSNR